VLRRPVEPAGPKRTLTRDCGSWHAFCLRQAALGSNAGAGWDGAREIAMAAEDPFAEFKRLSPHYKFETTPSGQRLLSAPYNSERSLLNFQPYAKKALAIAREHGLRNRPHSVHGSEGESLYNLIVIFP
jgi:hypothetical protein